MTTAKVQGAMVDRTTKGSTSNKSDSTSDLLVSKGKDASFSAIMEMQSSSMKEIAKEALQKNSVKDAKSYNSGSLVKDKAVNTVQDKENALGPVSGEEKRVQETGKDTKDLVDAETMEVLQSTMQNFLTELQETLGVTEEEFEQLLKDSGFTETDLLNPANLQAFILNQFGAESVTEALLNEPLANALQDGLSKLNELAAQIANLTGQKETAITTEIMQQILSEQSGQLMDSNLVKSDKGTIAKELMPEEKVLKAEDENLGKELTVTVEKEESTPKNQMGASSSESNSKREDLSRQPEIKTDFVDYFASRVNQASVDNISQTTEMTNVRNIITQIVDQIKININQAQTSMQVLLNPESLGHVELVVAHKEGMMTAHFTVENQVTKEALESSIHILKQQFEEQGLKVAEVEVTISNYSDGFTRNSDSNQTSSGENPKQRGRIQDLGYGEETEDATVSEAERTNYYGTVEYTA